MFIVANDAVKPSIEKVFLGLLGKGRILPLAKTLRQ